MEKFKIYKEEESIAGRMMNFRHRAIKKIAQLLKILIPGRSHRGEEVV